MGQGLSGPPHRLYRLPGGLLVPLPDEARELLPQVTAGQLLDHGDQGLLLLLGEPLGGKAGQLLGQRLQ